ncbi:Bax inhibitor-1/YccA family protein [Ureibacillus sp. Re31]|uniref:Bax inhibitor-1/YccA family protein n=1 Tax=Ureibacillus galli TaxID=2762222 RepID=A0ABR8X8P2_9BACL|nr:Bax inhibitor-1 family protein [Ureibacillus galli]MBD8025679.1 Bax inhibitor-1/YccA family protein [Ureibacillus galli]
MKNTNILRKVLKHFAIMWLLTGVGFFVGSVLPPTVLLPVSIITILLLIIAIFVRNIRMMNTILYCIPFLVGITFFWSTQFYIDQLGMETVLITLIGTIVIFAILGFIGSVTKSDLSGWGGYLFGILLVAILVSIVFFFFTPSNLILLLLAAVIILIFVLYTIYDFNRIAKGHVSEEDVVSSALDLYLDFINLFLNILELIWRIREEFK